MMRLICSACLAIFFLPHGFAQQTPIPDYARQGQPTQSSQAAAGTQNTTPTDAASLEQMRQKTEYLEAQRQEQARKQGLPVPGNPAAVPNDADQQPFPEPPLAAKQQLQKILLAWQHNSQGTKTLECKFQRWHYDMFAAPPGVHATKAEGVIRYAAPDKGKFKVENLVFFNGMVADKPTYKVQPGQFGEHWVCTGTELIEFDYAKEECRVQTLPPEMRGQHIFNSPLPFVFNLDAERIHHRYWVRQVAAPKPGVVLIEAWPKTQADRSQYKMVQVVLSTTTYLPEALIMYSPNFHTKTNPKWDHYEFSDMKRNSITQGFSNFVGTFLDKPPSSWKVIQENFMSQPQQAASPAPTERREHRAHFHRRSFHRKIASCT